MGSVLAPRATCCWNRTSIAFWEASDAFRRLMASSRRRTMMRHLLRKPRSFERPFRTQFPLAPSHAASGGLQHGDRGSLKRKAGVRLGGDAEPHPPRGQGAGEQGLRGALLLQQGLESKYVGELASGDVSEGDPGSRGDTRRSTNAFFPWPLETRSASTTTSCAGRSSSRRLLSSPYGRNGQEEAEWLEQNGYRHLA